MDGGEGVGYHKNTKGATPKLFKQMSLTVIGSTAHGEWMNYEVEVPESGEYYIKVYYSLAFDGTEANYSDLVKTSVYVDGEIVCDSQPLADTGSWLAYSGQDVAKVHMEKGKHIVKIQFVDGGYSYNKFKLIPAGMASNEPSYDDGTMFKPE